MTNRMERSNPALTVACPSCHGDPEQAASTVLEECDEACPRTCRQRRYPGHEVCAACRGSGYVEACDHARLKRDSVWPTLPLVGVQRLPATETEPAVAYALKNCPSCLSTLAKEIAA